jgi:hypothetical protein
LGEGEIPIRHPRARRRRFFDGGADAQRLIMAGSRTKAL